MIYDFDNLVEEKINFNFDESETEFEKMQNETKFSWKTKNTNILKFEKLKKVDEFPVKLVNILQNWTKNSKKLFVEPVDLETKCNFHFIFIFIVFLASGKSFLFIHIYYEIMKESV